MMITTEEKAKAYDEALKRAKILYNDKNEIGYANAESVLEEIFPLLKESKDERIRKEIINYFAKGKEYLSLCSIGKDDILAWLEKQAEQKLPIEKLPSEMKTIGESLGFTTQEECDKYNQMVSGLIMSDDDKDGQKPAWSEEDETNSYHLKTLLENLAKDIEHKFRVISENDRDKYTAWLESFKERVQLQPKQEWSEKDEQFKAQEPIEDEHWREVREHAAIAAMQGLLANPSRTGCFRDCAETAIEYVDALIEQLKTQKGE